jgi:hypothetical protein
MSCGAENQTALRECNQKIRTANESFENQNDIHDEIKSRLNSGNACYYSVQNLLSSRLKQKKKT